MYKTLARLAFVQRLVQRIQYEVCAHRGRYAPSHDAPCKHIGHKRYVHGAALDLATMRRQSGSHYLNGGNYFDIRKIALGQS